MPRKLTEDEFNQREYYNQIYEGYDAHYGSLNALRYRSVIYEEFLRENNICDFGGMKVLDAMCGGGQSTDFFSRRGASVFGVDISDGQCSLYRKRYPTCEVKCASVLECGYDNGFFDLVVTDSLHHLHPFVDECVEEFCRVLRPGGMILLWEPSAGSIFDYLRRVWYRVDRKYFEDNEASIDVDRLRKEHAKELRLVNVEYGGNFGYLINVLTMATRRKPSTSEKVFKRSMRVERFVQKLQSRRTSLWSLALFVKTKLDALAQD